MALPDEAWMQPERISSNFYSTVGDLLSRVPQQDASADEVMPLSQQLQLGDPVTYATITRPNRTIHRFRVASDNPLLGAKRQYRYRTLRGLMAATYPNSIVARTSEVLGSSPVTATQAVQYIIDQWEAAYPWLSFGTVPQLVLFIPDEAGEYTQEPTTEVIYLPQREGSKKSMLTFLQELLSAFVGYKLVLTSDEVFEIRSPEWAPGYSAGTTEVSEDDVIAPFPRPTLDDSNVRNLWTVSSRGMDFAGESNLIAPQFLRFGDYDGSEPDPALYEELMSVRGDPGTTNFDTVRGTIRFVDDDDLPILVGGDQVTINGEVDGWFSWAESSGGTQVDNHPFSFPNPNTFSLVVPRGGSASTTVSVSNDILAGGGTYLVNDVTITGRFLAPQDGADRLQITATRRARTPGGFIISRYYVAVVLRVDEILGASYGDTGEAISGSWGQDINEVSSTPGLGTSQAVYGILEGSLDLVFFTLDPVQCAELARSLCRWFMNPRARYEGVRLTVASNIEPDQLWQRFSLPVGQAGVLQGYRYSDFRDVRQISARTSADFEYLFDLEGSLAEPAGAPTGFAFGSNGGTYYAE